MKVHDRDSVKHFRAHMETVQRKRERVKTLAALIAMWDEREYSDEDYKYILELRARYRNAKNQLEAMGEEIDEPIKSF